MIRKLLCLLLPVLFLTGITTSGMNQSPLPARIRIIVPGGPGGGWDVVARAAAGVLLAMKAFRAVDVQNVPGAGGGRGIKTLINDGKRRQNVILVNSTPILLRHLNGTFPESFRDLTPLAAIIADYQTIAVRADSPYQTLRDLTRAIKGEGRKLAIVGASSPGSMDHVSAATVLQAGGISWREWNYVPAAKGGGDAMTMLLASSHIDALSTGASEVLGQMEAGKIRVLAVTSPERLAGRLGRIPTAIEQGFDATFVNWRGFFGPPALSEEMRAAYAKIFENMIETPEWRRVRDKNGWMDNFIPADRFTAFLQEEEQKMKAMLTDMGFLK